MTTRIAAILTLTIGLPTLGASQSSSGARSPHFANPPHVAPNVPDAIVGRWIAPLDQVPLSDENGWGRNASSVRFVQLRIDPDGTGTITVTRRVVNKSGVPFPGSRSVDRADFIVGPEDRPTGLRPRYTTTIRSASRRFQDTPVVEVNIEGLRVEIFPPAQAEPDSLEIDFMVFRGEGSFTTKLQRQRNPDVRS